MKVPVFLMQENRRDFWGRPPGDENYDERTLRITEDEFKELQPGFKRYWKFKQLHMDKILLYQFGDWYVLYFDDLSICN